MNKDLKEQVILYLQKYRGKIWRPQFDITVQGIDPVIFDWWNPLSTFDKLWIIENIWLPIAETNPKYLLELITLFDDKEQLISYLSFKNKEAKFFTKSMISIFKKKKQRFSKTLKLAYYYMWQLKEDIRPRF